MLLSDETGVHYIYSKNPTCSTKSELFDPRVVAFYSDETIDNNVKITFLFKCVKIREI